MFGTIEWAISELLEPKASIDTVQPLALDDLCQHRDRSRIFLDNLNLPLQRTVISNTLDVDSKQTLAHLDHHFLLNNLHRHPCHRSTDLGCQPCAKVCKVALRREGLWDRQLQVSASGKLCPAQSNEYAHNKIRCRRRGKKVMASGSVGDHTFWTVDIPVKKRACAGAAPSRTILNPL